MVNNKHTYTRGYTGDVNVQGKMVWYGMDTQDFYKRAAAQCYVHAYGTIPPMSPTTNIISYNEDGRCLSI